MQAASETATVAVLARDLIGKFVRARGIDGLVQKVLDPEKGSASGKAGSKKKKPPAATHVQIVSPFGDSFAVTVADAHAAVLAKDEQSALRDFLHNIRGPVRQR